MHELIVATRNRHKLQEIQAILGSSVRCVSLESFRNGPTLVEDGKTFIENATRKAVQLADWLAAGRGYASSTSELLVLADDTGLEVDALGGAPGVHSARFAAFETGQSGNSTDQDNIAKLLRLMEGIRSEHRTARFRCVLALTRVGGEADRKILLEPGREPKELETAIFEGVCEGRIGFAPRGSGGFGYDPLFIPEGNERSFSELPADFKNRISHRAKALKKLQTSLVTLRNG